MIKTMLLFVALLFAVPLGVAEAQTLGTQAVPGNQLQSIIREPRSACTAGSQGVRVCGNDFQSCNSACAATSVSAAASFEGCSQRCCNNFRTCLSLRGCANLTATDCFTPFSPEVRPLRGVE